MRIILKFISALSLALFAVSAMGQSSTTGSLEGSVTDPNGAAVRGATVTVTSPNLISAKTATTGENGRYQVGALPPGAYKVTIEGSGFGKFEQGDVGVNLGRTSTVDAQLSLATASATVTVTGGAAVDFTEATLVIDLKDMRSNMLIWRGVYHDNESDAKRLAEALPRDAAVLASEYPPKKRN